MCRSPAVATWGGTWHAAGTSPHTRRSALLHRASVRCLTVIASSQLPFETCSLYKTSLVTGVPRAGLLRNPLCTPQPLLLLLMTLLLWGWSDDRWLCITPDQCSGRVTSLFVSTVKTGGSQPALSFCVRFGYYSWCFVYHVSEYLIVINSYLIIRLHIIIILSYIIMPVSQ